MMKVTALAQMQQLALHSKNYFAGKLAEFVTRVTEAIEELNAAVASPVSVPFIIPTDGWTFDDAQPYGYSYDIAVNGVTASDRAEITLSPESAATAFDCGLCPTTETLANKIRIRAVNIPISNMAAEYWIEKGQGKE